MASQYVLAIDQGTTATTVLVLDMTHPVTFKVLAQATTQIKQYYPQPDWVEHDLEEIWLSVLSASTQAVTLAMRLDAQFSSKKIKAIGLTNQRETLCVFDRQTQEPLYKAIVWQCKRSAALCAMLKAQNLEKEVKERTGLVLDPYFTATKLTWLLESKPEIRRHVENGRACVGTIDTYLVARLTGGTSFVTEPSNASRTLWYNIETHEWDPVLMSAFRIKQTSLLPEVRQSVDHFGQTKGLGVLPDGIPITAILGDQQAALAGQGGFKPFDVKCTYGTGAFLLQQTGSQLVRSKHGLLTTIAWSINNEVSYALEGSCFIAGAAREFIKKQLAWVTQASDTAEISKEIVASPYVYFVPTLSGLGAPYWKPECKGAFLGLTRSTTKAQLIRATLEGIAFQVTDVLDALALDTNKTPSHVKVDGGAAANDSLISIQAHLANISLYRPKWLESTAIGVGLLAGLKAGLYADIKELTQAIKIDRVFSPEKTNESRRLREKQRQRWQQALKAIQVFASS